MLSFFIKTSIVYFEVLWVDSLKLANYYEPLSTSRNKLPSCRGHYDIISLLSKKGIQHILQAPETDLKI